MARTTATPPTTPRDNPGPPQRDRPGGPSPRAGSADGGEENDVARTRPPTTASDALSPPEDAGPPVSGAQGGTRDCGGAAPTAPRRAPLLILRYASVRPVADGPPASHQDAVGSRRLAEQLRWLRGRGLRGVSMAELLHAHAAGRAAGLVGLTFDGGYADFLSEAMPLLREFRCTATVFCLPGLLGGLSTWETRCDPSLLLTADQIREVADAGMEVGSRGLYHVGLRGADGDLLSEEIAGSRERLSRITGRPPAGFSYPWGRVDSAAVAAVSAAGYDYACAVDPGALTGRLALPRTPVAERDTPWRLAVKRRLHMVLRRPVPAEAEYVLDAATGRGAVATPPVEAGSCATERGGADDGVGEPLESAGSVEPRERGGPAGGALQLPGGRPAEETEPSGR